MARTITIVINENLDDDQYADFGNGIWSVLKMARPDGRFDLESDDGTPTGYLNERWAKHGRELPWK
jgi:hypothetical protein